MALDSAPALWIQRKVAFANTVTTGTVPSVSATDAVTPVFTQGNDEVISPEIEPIENESQGTFSAEKDDYGATGANVAFETNLFNSGSGTPPILISRLLVASGWVAGSGGVYTPVTGNTATVCVQHFLPTETRIASDCMFDWVLTAERGKPARMKWTGKGVWRKPDSSTITAPSYLTLRPPRVGATTCTIASTTYRQPKVEVAWGNELYLREDVTAVDADGDATGYRSACITNRKTRIRVEIEAIARGTKDWYSAYRSQTTHDMALAFGSGSNNVLTFAFNSMVLTGPPKQVNRNGLVCHALEFKPTRVSAGDDDASLTLS